MTEEKEFNYSDKMDKKMRELENSFEKGRTQGRMEVEREHSFNQVLIDKKKFKLIEKIINKRIRELELFIKEDSKSEKFGEVWRRDCQERIWELGTLKEALELVKEIKK